LFAYLEERWDQISPAVQQSLRDTPCIPVGAHTLVKASRVYFRFGRESLAPFMFEVPRAFGAHDKLLRALGAKQVLVEEILILRGMNKILYMRSSLRKKTDV